MSEEKRASVRLQEGMHFVADTDRGNQLNLDGAANHGGQGKGDSPMSIMLVGLAGCTAMDVISILRKMREPIEDFEVKVTGQRADGHPKVYTDIQVEYVITGDGVKPESVEKAIDLSVNQYCSASAMLQKTATLTTSYQILEGPLEQGQ